MMQGSAWARLGLRLMLVAGLLGLTPSLAQAAPAASMPAAAAAPSVATYVLRYGDTLNLLVLENEKLKVENQPLRPDGRISFPLIGEVVAGGLTVAQLQARLTQMYSRYYNDPHVVLNVATFRKLSISVMGQVGQSQTLQVYEPIRLLDALAHAGGPNVRAELHRVIVIRAKGQVEEVDLTLALAGETASNVWLMDGDTVQVLQMQGIDWAAYLPQMVSMFAVLANVAVVVISRFW